METYNQETLDGLREDYEDMHHRALYLIKGSIARGIKLEPEELKELLDAQQTARQAYHGYIHRAWQEDTQLDIEPLRGTDDQVEPILLPKKCKLERLIAWFGFCSK